MSGKKDYKVCTALQYTYASIITEMAPIGLCEKFPIIRKKNWIYIEIYVN